MGIFDGILGAVTPFVPFLGPAVSLLTGLSGSHESKEGQEDANVANANMSREQMAFNADQARINREFQEQQSNKAMSFAYGQAQESRSLEHYLSNTAIQRGAADAAAAGFNPMLQFMRGTSASTPNVPSPNGSMGGGSSATSPGLPTMQNTKGMSVMTGIQAAEAAAQVQKTLTEIEEVKSRTELNRANVPRAQSDISLNTARTALAEAEGFSIYERLRVLMPEEHALLVSQVWLSNMRHWSETLHNRQTEAEIKTELERAGLTRAEARLAELNIPRAVNEARAQEDWWKRVVGPYMGDAQHIGSTAASLAIGGGIGLRAGRGAAQTFRSSAAEPSAPGGFEAWRRAVRGRLQERGARERTLEVNGRPQFYIGE